MNSSRKVSLLQLLMELRSRMQHPQPLANWAELTVKGKDEVLNQKSKTPEYLPSESMNY